MHLVRLNKVLHWLRSGVWVVALICCVACSSILQSGPSLPSSSTRSTPLPVSLPGQQIWKQGISSFLFGTNDTYEYKPQNIETQSAVQEALRNAGFTLIRSFFPDRSSDAAIEQRVQTIERSDASCLGVITNISDIAFDEHLVRYLGNRCQMYEFGNEPDINGISIDTYLQLWNKVVPLLRQINPTAKFVGPVTHDEVGNHGFMQKFLVGVKASGILPDAVSFHGYACYQDAEDACLSKASTYGSVALGVRTLVKSILGKDLPVGISEWNYDPENPPPSYGDNQDFITKFSTEALRSMAQAGVAFACQFDAASYAGYGHLDMFDLDSNLPKPQYYAIKAVIATYRPSSAGTPLPLAASLGAYGNLISRGKPTYCLGNDAGVGGPGAIVNGHYGNWSFWRSSLSSLPSWCAIHVGVGPKRLLLAWYSDYVFDYISDSGLGPQDYTISVSSDSTDGADGTWRTVVTVTGNHTRDREHLLPFAGQSWVKMTVTTGQPQPSQPYAVIDQIDLYDVSTSLAGTFLFSGDSITAIAYNRSDEQQPSFAEDVHAVFPRLFPLMLDGGLGGESSDAVVQDIDLWLSLNPDVHYWLLEWGTNDALGQVSPAHFRGNLQFLIDKIKRAGHIPILARLPFANRVGDTSLDQEIQSLNAVIDQVSIQNSLIAGPDFYQLFLMHATEYLRSDGIHPTPAGAVAMNLAWFSVLRPYIHQ